MSVKQFAFHSQKPLETAQTHTQKGRNTHKLKREVWLSAVAVLQSRCTQRWSFLSNLDVLFYRRPLKINLPPHGFRRRPWLQIYITERQMVCWKFLHKHYDVVGEHFFHEWIHSTKRSTHILCRDCRDYPHILHIHADTLTSLSPIRSHVCPLLRN